jgi:glycosyltransferase involved in cell wall biosynthesis
MRKTNSIGEDNPAASAGLKLPVSNGAVEIKPKVLILIATDPIGGPGKGLFQFLKYAPGNAFDYLLCNFNVKDRPEGKFIQEARRRKLNLMLLDQRTMIDPHLIFEARKIVLEQGIDLIQTHGYKSHLIGFFLRLFCRSPWIAFAHGYTYGNWKMRLYNRMDLLLLRFADRVVAVSDATRRLLERNGVPAEKIELIYNAIDPDDAGSQADAAEVRRRHGLAPDQKVIGVIGRFNPEKGQGIFLKAMKKVVQHCPEVKALLIGDGPDQTELERYCREYGLRDRVVFTGYQENISDYYQILDLLVLPSLSEGLPNTVLEAMSFAVPVVATSVGGVPEVIEKENGVLVPPNDPEALAKGMIELLQNESLRKTIGSKGRTSLHPRFAPDHRVEKIIALYHELLLSRSGENGSRPT